jgi:hypothetical protein
MKHKFGIIGLLAGGLVSSHSASSDAAGEQIQYQYRGEIAQLALFQQTEITCENGSSGLLDTSVAIELFFDGVRSSLGNTETRSVMLFFSQYSSCTGISQDVCVLEEPAEYTQDGVQSASFADSFELVDVYTGDPMGTLTLDVQFTGVGQTGHFNTHSTYSCGEFDFDSHSNGMFRAAEASGSVDLDGTELIDSGQFATLSDVHTGKTSVTY